MTPQQHVVTLTEESELLVVLVTGAYSKLRWPRPRNFRVDSATSADVAQ